MENKVAMLSCIKMQMSPARVDLELVFEIKDEEAGDEAIAPINRADGRPPYQGLEEFSFMTQFRLGRKSKQFSYFWFNKQEANASTV